MKTEQFRIGQRVQVDAHGQHEEDFSGVITRVDDDNYLVTVEAPDGELYGCTMAFVRDWPEEYECVFILGSPETPHLCYQCGKTRAEHAAKAVQS